MIYNKLNSQININLDDVYQESPWLISDRISAFASDYNSLLDRRNLKHVKSAKFCKENIAELAMKGGKTLIRKTNATI